MGAEEQIARVRRDLEAREGSAPEDGIYRQNVDGPPRPCVVVESAHARAILDELDRLRAMLGADPLAALEAAERRLLEAGGWHLCPASAEFGAERWRRGSAPDAHESRTVALTIERRRLAAKGGA